MRMSDAQGTATSPDQPAANNNTATDHKRSSKDSINPITCPFPHTVKEAVAIAAGKKESDGDDDDGKNIRSNMLCYLYWLLVVLILGLISFTVWLSIQLARRHGEINDHRKNFDFDDIFDPTFQPKSFEATWVKSDAYAYMSGDGHLYLYNVSNKNQSKLMDNSVTEQLKPASYVVSRDLKFVLISHDVQKVWRHSHLAKYAIYDTHVSPGVPRLHKLGEGKRKGYESDSEGHLQFAKMAPTSPAVAFVSNNNLFLKESIKKPAKQLTFSGREGGVFNGVSDWTYEDIFKDTSALWWSTDSRYICYLSINSSSVSKFNFIKYKGANSTVSSIPHPKALPTGHIPNVTVRLIDTDELKDENFHSILLPPPEFINIDYYVVKVIWLDNSRVLVIWHNRPHTQSISTIYNVIDDQYVNIHYQTISNGWISLSPQVLPLTPGGRYLTILPKLEADGIMWDHLAVIDGSSTPTKPVEAQFLTHGGMEVVGIAGYDEKHDEAFYLSTNKEPKERHLFSINLKTKASKCLTFNISECKYVSASFGEGGSNYILGCLGPGIPKYRLKQAHSSKEIMLEDNKALSTALASKILPDKKFLKVPLGDEIYALAEVLFPQEEGSKKFPLLIQASGEPGEQLVSEKFSLGWETYMASKEEVIVAKIDVRGSGGRGKAYQHKTYKKITQVDVDDLQLAGLHFKNHELVDPAKVAIWGWGFAGILALHALANDTDVFPCGIVGGSLLDPALYDASTFERYMGLASDDNNYAEYMKTDVSKKLGFMRNKKLALIQGTADDNIRFVSSQKVMNILSDNDIPYRLQIYQDLNSYQLTPHRHAYHYMTEFLKQDCYVYFWKHDTKTWIVDKSVKKDKFRIKQFCV